MLQLSPFRAAFFAKEYANMPFKTNRTSFFSMFLLFLSCAISLPIDRLLGQGPGASTPSKVRQTPEERAAEKQKAFEMQNELAIMRQKKFGMLPEGDDSEIGKRYRAAFEDFRDAAVDLNQVQMNFHLTSTLTQAFKDNINDRWQSSIHKGHLAKENWLKTGAEIFLSNTEKYAAIGETLCEMMLSDVEVDRTDGWLEAARAVVNSKKFENEEVLRAGGLIGYANCDFDFAEDCMTRSDKFHEGKESRPRLIGDISILREKWARELEFRKKEAEKNDNPQVRIVTTKGSMIVELYEDAAPETVKSFIYLVERNFYSRKTFFRVEKHLVAQTGCEKGDGTGDAGYTIPSETGLQSHRDHFRGSIAMALGSDANGKVMPETGSSQVYFAFLPMTHLDGSYTVFGRIIEGQETMNTLRIVNLADPAQKKEGKKPDVIISANVIRKRNTDYTPRILAGKLPK